GGVARARERVWVCALGGEGGTRFHPGRAGGRPGAVDDDVESAMLDAAGERLAAAGFRRYEISSWARTGFESRHNTRYWDGSDYLGIGPGAHSFCATPAPRRWWNLRLPHRWRDAGGRQGTLRPRGDVLTAA